VIDDESRTLRAGAEETQTFRFRRPNLTPEKITVRVKTGKREHAVALNKILLVRAHETTLTASTELFAGSNAALRCSVRGVRSLTETVPLAGADVSVRLRAADGKARTLHTGKARADGVADVAFAVPEVPAGSYKLEVVTKSVFGEEKLERAVNVKSVPRVLLTTDKPLYQPGQVIRIRALALRAFDLKPASAAALTLEVEDARGNKVFKKEQKTSDHGIASADFQLADEVNMGDYRVRAILGDHTADKSVTVKQYVLPKFKTDLSTDKTFYLPKETVKGNLRVDYFFGKPVAKAQVEVKASTFDVAFKEFHSWKGKTDERGHAEFQIKLPNYFVGLPLQKGNALVRLEVKVTDTADHSETISRTYPVSDQPIRVSLIPEAGRLVPDLENRVFVAALYPDGRPAQCGVEVWTGQAAQGKPFATVKTNEAGLAEVKLTPKTGQFRQAGWGQRQVEMLGGTQQAWGPQHVFDLTARARDQSGNKARATVALTTESMGDNLLVRLDKAIYKGGDALNVEVTTSAGTPTVYLDVIKAGQVMLTRWLDARAGKAKARLDLPEALFGSLEVHAYQLLSSGEIIRDSRVVYVHPATELRIAVNADRDVYRPGADGVIQFQVTDSAGKATAAALGVLVVDEAVYALQDMQPGLEKVYFTLQQELLKPQAQAVYKPAENLDGIIRQPVVGAQRQQVARALLTAVRPKMPARWTVEPSVERRQKFAQQMQQIAHGLFYHALASKEAVVAFDKKTSKWDFRSRLLEDAVKANRVNSTWLKDPFGEPITLAALARLEGRFTADNFASAVTQARLQQLAWGIMNLGWANQARYLKGGKWEFPLTILPDAARQRGGASLKDAWGREIRLQKREGKNTTGAPQFDGIELVSAGPDGKFGTRDDVTYKPANEWQLAVAWWQPGTALNNPRLQVWNGAFFGAMGRGGAGLGGMPPMAPGMRMPQAAARAGGPMPDLAKRAGKDDKAMPTTGSASGGGSAASEPPTRLREYFPETLLWRPALITDEKGRATLKIPFADSITTWRLTASASSKAGALGGVSAPLRVFQDFFVDLDLPVALTQNDEVAFPVAVYNYLKTPQKVTLKLKQEPGFQLVDGLGLERTLSLKPGEVTSVKFRIRATKVGMLPLTVDARGSKMSDAIKRSIEVRPDGRAVEQVFNDRLKDTAKHTVTVPAHAIEGASRLLVKVYPGVVSQVLEGTEGMLRLPGG
jgi:5-hydroxyisourate hydrolase-like protein (transthyretin family)